MCIVFLYILLIRINKNISIKSVTVVLRSENRQIISAMFYSTYVHYRNVSVLKNMAALLGFAKLQQHKVSISAMS